MNVTTYKDKLSSLDMLIADAIEQRAKLVQSFQEQCLHTSIASRCINHEDEYGRYLYCEYQTWEFKCVDCGATIIVEGNNHTAEYIQERIKFKFTPRHTDGTS